MILRRTSYVLLVKYHEKSSKIMKIIKKVPKKVPLEQVRGDLVPTSSGSPAFLLREFRLSSLLAGTSPIGYLRASVRFLCLHEKGSMDQNTPSCLAVSQARVHDGGRGPEERLLLRRPDHGFRDLYFLFSGLHDHNPGIVLGSKAHG